MKALSRLINAVPVVMTDPKSRTKEDEKKELTTL